jgi:hypothetical protein
MNGTECSETSAYTFQTPCNRPKERIQTNKKVLVYLKSDYMLRVHILTAEKVRYKQISLTSFQTFRILLKFYGKILLIFVFHCSFLLTLFWG